MENVAGVATVNVGQGALEHSFGIRILEIKLSFSPLESVLFSC